MGLAKCEDCGHDVSTAAAACPHCGRPQNAAPAPAPTAAASRPVPFPAPAAAGAGGAAPQLEAPAKAANPKKSWFRRHPILTVILAVILVAIIADAASNGGSGSSPANTAASTPSTPAASSSAPPAANSTPPAPSMTEAQKQAVESAQSYLSMGSGFSRSGLIKQLSSSYGEGFPKSVATFAVDHLHVDWNQQAVLSAKNYLSMGSGFSRNGLIQQLSSSYGEGFTHAQAVYAANQVGL